MIGYEHLGASNLIKCPVEHASVLVNIASAQVVYKMSNISKFMSVINSPQLQQILDDAKISHIKIFREDSALWAHGFEEKLTNPKLSNAIEQYYQCCQLTGQTKFVFPVQNIIYEFSCELIRITKGKAVYKYYRKVLEPNASAPAYILGYREDLNKLKDVFNNYCISNFIAPPEKQQKHPSPHHHMNQQIAQINNLMQLFGVKIPIQVEEKHKADAPVYFPIKENKKLGADENIMLASRIINKKDEDQKIKQKLDFPSSWENIESVYQQPQSLPVMKDKHKEEWFKIETEFHKTMPKSTILTIERLQNMWTWNHYLSERNNFIASNIRPNESYLFHGTGKTDPQSIIESRVGLDLLYSNDGRFGKALYISTSAEYSDKFAYSSKGVKKMFFIRALIGNTFCSQQKAYLELPKNPETNLNYDSVHDPSKTIYAIKRSTQAYPAYLITYS